VRTFVAVLRYEFRMQVRKRSVWLVPALSILLILLIGFSLLRDLFDPAEARTVAKAAMIELGIQLNAVLPIGYGCLLADRLIRDDRLRVAPVLDATPARSGPRLLGKYLGTATATAIPIVAIYAVLAVAYAVHWGQSAALGWALVTFGLVMVPGLLFVAAFALTVPLIMPAPLFRVLFVGYWIWGFLVAPAMMPTLAHSVIQPGGGYAVNALLDHYGIDGDLELAGPVPGAALNFLRPEPTAPAGWLSIAILLVLAAAVLAGGQALRTHRTR
jgi:ABC-2 type transport system permease protein